MSLKAMSSSNSTSSASQLPSLTLHKFTVVPDEDDTAHQFTLVLDNVGQLLSPPSSSSSSVSSSSSGSVDSTELSYAGQRWSVLVQRSKDHRYLGAFLKWRYAEHSGGGGGGSSGGGGGGGGGNPASPGLSCKVRYSLTVVNRLDVHESKRFSSNQIFSTSSSSACSPTSTTSTPTRPTSSAQTMLGKSRLVESAAVLDAGAGWTDCTGRRLILTLVMTSCSVTYRHQLCTDQAARQRARKNANGSYFDTPAFHHCGHRWYLRAYPCKLGAGGGGGGGNGIKGNNGGEPAVYMYLANRTRHISMELCFTLKLCDRNSEILTYGFGEGAKYDGFGKTLTANGGVACSVDLTTADSLVVGVEITSVNVFKDVCVNLLPPVTSSHSTRGMTSAASNSSVAVQFADHEGNSWRLDYRGRECTAATFALDKPPGGVGGGGAAGHYSRGKLVAFSAFLLAQDPDTAQDLDHSGGRPLVAKFANTPDDRPARFTFPLDSLQVCRLFIYMILF